MKQWVTVWNDSVEIDVHQKSGTKSVWIAMGEYLGKYHEVKRSSASSAAKAWADAAKYHSG